MPRTAGPLAGLCLRHRHGSGDGVFAPDHRGNLLPTALIDPFVLPILMSAYLGGLGPGLLATLAAAFGVIFLLIPPAYSFAIDKSADLIQWLMLIVSGVCISVLTEALHRFRRRVEASRLLTPSPWPASATPSSPPMPGAVSPSSTRQRSASRAGKTLRPQAFPSPRCSASSTNRPANPWQTRSRPSWSPGRQWV